MVVTGTPIENAQYSEVIDLLDSDAKCEPLMDFPIQAYSGTGGLLQNNQPLICGGYNPFNGWSQNKMQSFQVWLTNFFHEKLMIWFFILLNFEN